MATNIPPHNLIEVIDGVLMVIEDSEVTISDLMTKIKGPDFPTGGIILGRAGIKSAYETGRGRILVRAKTDIEENKGRNTIIVTELPYQVNKAKLIEGIADLVKDKKIDGISDLRDESDREGMRIVIELKRDANPNIVLNRLFKHTRMQDTFGVIMIALVNNEPLTLNLKQILVYYLEHQKDVIRRRTQFDLDKALARAHILEGLKIALDHIDEVIRLIRASKTISEAKESLMSSFDLSEKQATAIVEMRLGRLTGLERGKIEDEYNELMKTVNYLKGILADELVLLNIIRDELIEVRNKYGDTRRSSIEKNPYSLDEEDLIQEQDIVITLTHAGYIKRLPADTYSSQKRGGRGIQGVTTKEDDFVEHIFITTTHNNILFFTNKGKSFKLKAYEIPEGGRTAKGTNLINIIPLASDEKIQAVICLKEFAQDNYLVMGTKNGLIKKTSLDKYSAIRKNGLNAINLREDDELIGAAITNGDSEMLFVTRNGYSIRFSEKDVRGMGRTATGVKSLTLREEDIVVSMNIVTPEEELLVISENGFGKRTLVSEYSLQHRGGKGVITYKVSAKTGKLVGARIVKDGDEMILINSNGIVIRLNVAGISTTSRNTMGVTLMKNGEGDNIVAIAKINSSDVIDTDEESSDGETNSEVVQENSSQDGIKEASVNENQDIDVVDNTTDKTEE